MNSEMMGLKINLINSLFSLSSIPPYLKFNLGKDHFSINFKSWLISIFMILNLNKLLKILTDAISYEYHFFQHNSYINLDKISQFLLLQNYQNYQELYLHFDSL